LAGSTLYVADTNNFQIRTVDVSSGRVRTLALSGLNPPARPKAVPSFPRAVVNTAAEAKVVPGKAVTLHVKLPLPAKTKVNPDAGPMPYMVEATGKSVLVPTAFTSAVQQVDPPADDFKVEVPLTGEPAAGDRLELKLSVQAFVCDTGSNLCQIKSYVWTVPVVFNEDGEKVVTLTAKAR
jgi:hypothetical protein